MWRKMSWEDRRQRGMEKKTEERCGIKEPPHQ